MRHQVSDANNQQAIIGFPQSVRPSVTPNPIICGEAAQELKRMPDGCVDLVVTDPPYLINYKDRSHRTVANDNNPDAVLSVFDEVYRVLKNDSYCISFYGWSAIAAFSSKWEELGFRVVGQLIWPKPYASSSRVTRCQHECAFILAKGNPPVPRQPISDVQAWQYSGNVLHPTEKNVSILTPLIRSFSRPGALVLDPFAGSGSTCVAAATTGRNYIGIELESRYCQTARNRLRLELEKAS